MVVHEIYLALGANLGDRWENIRQAVALLPPAVKVEAVSPLYEPEPWGEPNQPRYLNCACRATTALEPREVLAHVKGIEKKLGRRPGKRWGPRPIDIDIIFYDAVVIDGPNLTIPHPRMLERAFVLRPLVDLDPNLVHPVTGERLTQVLAGIGERSIAPTAPW